MKKIQLAIVTIMMAVGIIGGALVPSPVFGDAKTQITNSVNQVGGSDAGNNISLQNRIKTIVNILLFVIGMIAVIVIVVGGLRYVTSGGDSSQVAGAKNTILYAVVGLIVAILAYAIVNFVVKSF